MSPQRDSDTSVARIARNQDVPGIIRVVGGMHADMAEEYAAVRPPAEPEWMRAAESNLSEHLGGDVMAFVVDHPSSSGDVAAVAVGRLQTTLPNPRRRGTSAGYVDWIATDPEMRRRGFARAAVTELLCWFKERDAGVVELHASSTAEPMYREMGFVGGGPVSLSRRL